MEFPSPLTQAVLLKRYKRFLAEVAIGGEHRTIYCPNRGAMRGCDILGSRVWFSRSFEPWRQFPWTWELVEIDGGHWVHVNTQKTLALVKEAVEKQILRELVGYTWIRERRNELLLSDWHQGVYDERPKSILTTSCVVACQSVTLGDEVQRGFFPEAPTEQGFEQLRALITARHLGYRAILIYCVHNTGINQLFPADHIDFQYGCLLRQAVVAGVEVVAYRVVLSLQQIQLLHPIEVCVPARMWVSH